MQSGSDFRLARTADEICLVLRNVLFLCGVALVAQENSRPVEPSSHPVKGSNQIELPEAHPAPSQGPVDVLTDTRGVDLSPYINRLRRDVHEHWYKVIPHSTRPPVMKKGTVVLGFRIMKDGKITALHYVASSGDAALDQAAHDGVASSSPVQPLPKEFVCEYVALQFHFYYNPQPGDIDQTGKDQPFPCVTSSIQVVGEIGVTISPSAAEVASGAKQQFSVTITGAMKSTVNWSVSGSGCAASDCGSISADGLYTAPDAVPNPPKVTITAGLPAAPDEAGFATVTIVGAKPSH